MSGDDEDLSALLQLRSVPFFQGLRAKELAAIAAISTLASYRVGECVFSQGQRGDHMYILLSGHVDVVRDGTTIATLQDGDCFGEGAVLDGTARSASIVARHDPTRLTVIARDDLFELLELYPSVAHAIAMTLIGRYREMVD